MVNLGDKSLVYPGFNQSRNSFLKNSNIMVLEVYQIPGLNLTYPIVNNMLLSMASNLNQQQSTSEFLRALSLDLYYS